MQVYAPRLQQTTDEEYGGRLNSPYHLAFVDRVDVIDLHADIAGRTRPIEHVGLNIPIAFGEGRTLAAAQMGGGDTGEGGQSQLESLLFALHLQFEVARQGFVAEGGNEDGLRQYGGVGGNGIGQLVDITEEAGLKQRLDNGLAVHLRRVFRAKVHGLLLRVCLHSDAAHLPALAAHHFAYCATDGRSELHFGILLVDKQGLPGLDMVALMNDNLGNDTLEIGRGDAILPVGFQLDDLAFGLALKVNVQAFA